MLAILGAEVFYVLVISLQSYSQYYSQIHLLYVLLILLVIKNYFTRKEEISHTQLLLFIY